LDQYAVDRTPCGLGAPRGGDWLADDMNAWREAGATIIVSLLEVQESADLGLEDESMAAKISGLQFISFPIEDRNVPTSTGAAHGLLNKLGVLLKGGASILIHCRQGIGRSGLVAIALLIQAGKRVGEAIEIVGAARGLPVPETAEQLAWLEAYGAQRALYSGHGSKPEN
jgi:protein-tyrosine phosphatase